MPRWLRRLRARLKYRHFDRDLRAELDLHRQLEAAELQTSGQSLEEAEAAARRALGNVTLVRESARHVWIPARVESVGQDVRYAVRTLARRPGFAATALATLTLAIGLNVSLFAVFNAIYIRPWPVAAPQDLFVLSLVPQPGQPDRGMPGMDLFYRDFQALEAAARADLVAFGPHLGLRLNGSLQAADRLRGLVVSQRFFEVAGAPFVLGRGFSGFSVARDGPIAVLSHRAWRSRFNGDPGIVGRTIQFNREPTRIVGVLDARFAAFAPSESYEIFVPYPEGIAWAPTFRSWWGDIDTDPATIPVQVVGRTRGGSWDEAGDELTALHRAAATDPDRAARDVGLFGTAPGARPGGVKSSLPRVFAMLFAACLLVLVVASANVGNLQLARGLARRREIATRLAIGANRARVIRQLVTEGAVLAGVSACGGMAVAWLLPSWLLRFIGGGSDSASYGPDLTVLVFAIVLCAGSTLAFALVPALQITQTALSAGTRSGAHATVGGIGRLRSVMMGSQVAISTVLLVGAALLGRNLHQQIARDLAFTEGLQVAMFDVPRTANNRLDEPRSLAASASLAAAIDRAGFLDLAYVATPPLGGGYRAVRARRSSDAADVAQLSIWLRCSPRFFPVLRIPFVSGRPFADDGQEEVVVNQRFVEAVLQGANPIGADVTLGTLPRTVVGVVEDRYLAGPDAMRPMVFSAIGRDVTPPAVLFRDSPRDERATFEAIARDVDPGITVRLLPLDTWVPRAVTGALTGATLATAIGGLALGLATVGVFGLFGYLVEERRREIGIRLALGARRADVVRLLFVSTSTALAGGLAIGLAAAPLAATTLDRYLRNLSPLDPPSYAAVVAILAGAAALATIGPARRALRVDPAVTLRAE